MDLARIRELLEAAAASPAAEIEFEENGMKIVVRRNAPPVIVQPQVMLSGYGAGAPPPPPAPARAEEAKVPEDEGVVVRAPTPGTFYSAPSPDDDPFVAVGDTVKPGDVLCIIEAMKLMNEIVSEHAGTVRKVYVTDADPVEYDQPLLAIDPA